MSDTTILYAGMFCFGFILLGFVLTVIEFKQMRRQRNEAVSGSRRLPPDSLAVDSAAHR